MAVETTNKQKAKTTEWITGGAYAVAVEVEATYFLDRPGEPFLDPQTVRFLEQVAKDANSGNLEALKKVGTVFVAVDKSNGQRT